MTEERIKKRIEELTAARDKFVAEAQQQIAAYNGAIGELGELLKPVPPAPVAEPGQAVEGAGGES